MHTFFFFFQEFSMLCSKLCFCANQTQKFFTWTEMLYKNCGLLNSVYNIIFNKFLFKYGATLNSKNCYKKVANVDVNRQ